MNYPNKRKSRKEKCRIFVLFGIFSILLAGCRKASKPDSALYTASVTPAPVPKQDTAFEEGIYKIVNKSTGRALNMQLCGMINGCGVVQYQEGDTMEFLWKVEKKGENYSIESVLTPRYMSVRDDSDQAGDIIEVRTPLEENNQAQLWKLVPQGDFLQIISVKSGLSAGLTSDDISTDNKVQLVQYSGADRELWQFKKVELQDDLPCLLPVDGDVFDSSCPEIMKYGDTYYMYIMAPHISIKASKDLINWDTAGTVFPGGDPDWLSKEVPGYGIWAPGIYKIKDKYYCYYCISTIGSQNSAIGAAVNKTLDMNSPDYDWVDLGMVIRSHTGDDYNCIDPNIFTDDNNDVWLTFGSYWNGIYQHRIDPDTGLLSKQDTKLYHIAQRPGNNTAIEAPYLIKKDKYYYLFDAYNPMNNSYHNVVSRSESVHGPFYDREGKEMLQGGGTEVTKSMSSILMPGHASVFHDDDGKYYLVSEYFRENSPSIMLISTIVWDKDGWPVTALTPNAVSLLSKSSN